MGERVSQQDLVTAKRPVQAFTSALDEGEQIRIDHIGMGGGHAMRVAFVGFQRAIGQQLG